MSEDQMDKEQTQMTGWPLAAQPWKLIMFDCGCALCEPVPAEKAELFCVS